MYPNDDLSLTVDSKWVVGDTFLSNFYSIFDWKQKKVGLIKPKSDSDQTQNRQVKEEVKEAPAPTKQNVQVKEEETSPDASVNNDYNANVQVIQPEDD